MCTLAAYVGCWTALPLLIAANRDEYLDRPSADPAVISHDPWVFAGRDLHAGGTWLGVNQRGLVAGLLNRRTAALDPGRRSRGLLCLEVLQQPDRAVAIELLRGIDGRAYNPFNLLLADAHGADVATNWGGSMRLTPLRAGVHLLTNLELDDPTCPRISASSQLFRATPATLRGDPAALIAPLRRILADHRTALDPRASAPDALCVHRPAYGTRSASIIAVEASDRVRYWHASGPPCRAEFSELILPA
ncbi:MAG: NRDE family protein [Candidatus Binatia bacterium]